MIEEIGSCLKELESDASVGAIVFCGTGKFFSFGFDIPGFLSYSKDEFLGYLRKFTSLYTWLYLFPKPVVAALNGHTIAGGCMLALACDRRIMTSGKARISLNEITFGSSVFAGSVEMLRHLVGQKNAELILCSGAMYSAQEAHRLGLIDEVADGMHLREQALRIASDLAQKDSEAFKSIKRLLRKPIAEEMVAREESSIREFLDIWYSEQTWRKLQGIEIHS
jgi:enoyl-CoA hydratase/carnithine racemase